MEVLNKLYFHEDSGCSFQLIASHARLNTSLCFWWGTEYGWAKVVFSYLATKPHTSAARADKDSRWHSYEL